MIAQVMCRGAAGAALFAALASTGCFFIPKTNGMYGYSAQSHDEAVKNAQASADNRIMEQVDAARAKVKKSPGGMEEARVFAQMIAAAFELGAVKRSGADGEGLLKEGDAALDAAVIAFPAEKAEAMFSKGAMYLAAQKTEQGISALRESMEAKASPRACVLLIGELDKQGDPKKEILPMCKKARPNVASDETKFALLDSCIVHTHAQGPDDGLKWAGAADIKFYKDYSAKLEQEEEDRRRAEASRRAQEDAERERRRQEDDRMRQSQQATSGGSSSNAPSASGWHLSLHNSCSKTVKLFLGKKPKWGSGTSTSLGSNTTTSYSGLPGDMIWIVDNSENGLSSLTPSGNQRMQILSSCTGFGPY